MPDERRHEAADLRDYEVLDASDTLDGAPGDDPLDRGVATPERWSAGMRYGTTESEQEAGESLDQLLAEEEPEETAESDLDEDENATDDEVGRYFRDDLADPRAGRLAGADDSLDDDDTDPDRGDLVGHDEGIDGAGATAEEAAVHVVADDDLS